MTGKLKLFHGTMNASKSAQILMQAYNFERQGKRFIIFKPSVDTRDGGFVKSRALSEKRPATIVSRADNGVIYSTAMEERPDFIFVDEIQFMPKEQVDELAHVALDFDITIFAYGLLISYTGELFEGAKRAIECGFSLHELKMQCDLCPSKSTHHLLYVNGEIVSEGNPVHVGDTEFKSVCYACYCEHSV
jgi:thymidine kinase